MVNKVTHRKQAGRVHSVEAQVLQKITLNIPATPAWSRCNRKHLEGFSLADANYGMLKTVDLLLGADGFSCVVLHGRLFRSSGFPTAFNTQFGWVLAGTTG